MDSTHVDATLAVAKRIGRGEQPAAIAAELGGREEMVSCCVRAIIDALPNPRHQFTSVAELGAALEARGLLANAA
ncbi:MAG: hypothetical protein ACLPV4_14315 [Solirubrobacteraceae bacterium]